MEGCCLDCFIKQGNLSSFYDNGGGDDHQYNDTIREFHLHLSDSKLQNAATTTAHAEQFGFDPDGQIQNEFFDNNRSLSMEGCCLDCFIKQSNESNFNDNDGGDVHQSNDTIWEFHLHLPDSKLQNAATATAHLHTLLAKVFEGKKL